MLRAIPSSRRMRATSPPILIQVQDPNDSARSWSDQSRPQIGSSNDTNTQRSSNANTHKQALMPKCISTKSTNTRFIRADTFCRALTPATVALCETIKDELLPPGDDVREWQAFAMQDISEGRDVVVKQSTGAGKSLLYQGLTKSKSSAIVLVIVPTLALMMDQACPIYILV